MDIPEFKWDAYLRHTNSDSVPEIAFVHVEHSLESLFQPDTVIEIVSRVDELQVSPLKGKRKKSPSASLSTTHYWPATIIMSCNPLLFVRFIGYTDSRHDKWIDPLKHEFHPLNWAKENGRSLSPPEDLRDIVGPDLNAFLNHHLRDLKSISHNLLELGKMGTCPIDFIKADDTLEVQDEQDLNVVWIAKVIKNMGGRLHLRYLGAKSPEQDFWLFYLASRIHYPNWAQKKNIPYKYPKGIMKTPEVDLLLAHILKEKSTIPIIIFKPQIDIPLNTRFEPGMGLEILWRNDPTQIYPGVVSRVQSYQHFQILLLNDARTLLSCHCGMSNILRANWAMDYDMPFKKPYANFTWENYGRERGKSIPPSSFSPTLKKCENPGFVVDMKLECFHPLKTNELYVATIKKIAEPLLLLEFDSTQETFLFPLDSQELFPMGWSFTNNCPLFAPKWERPITPPPIASDSKIASNPNLLMSSLLTSTDRPNEDRLTSLIIYINSRCFSGNNLNKGKLSVLPKQFGPGKMSLVLSEAITRIINVGYKPSSLLKDILEHKWSSHLETEKKRITIKCSGKSHEGLINLVRNPDQIEDYCKEFCCTFNCCPYLLGLQVTSEECSEKCSKYKKSKFGQSLRRSGRKGPKKGPKVIAVKREDPIMSESKKENVTTLPEPSRMVTRQSGNNGDPSSKFHSLVEKYQAKRDIPKVNKFSWHKQKFNKLSNPATSIGPAPRGRPKGSTKRSEENLPPVPKLPSNPINWSVDDAYNYICTTRGAPMAHWFKDNAFDGKALLTITKPQLCLYDNFNERGYELINETVIHIWLSYYLHYAQHKFRIEQ